MLDWSIKADELKWYAHFDRVILPEKINKLVNDPVAVARHAFHPFIRFDESFQPFRQGPQKKPDKKVRPIRYAGRADAYIYKRYRGILAARYEALLAEHGISDCVLAYRKIPVVKPRKGGKCNIHFAAEAFESILDLGQCSAVTLDISSFFDSIDHAKLKKIWCRLLGVATLPADHYAVYKNITRYADVSREDLYISLGFAQRNSRGIIEYHLNEREMPKQLCAPARFRQVARSSQRIVRRNPHPYGIPQGSPISDVLANAYLFDFDLEMAAYASSRGGVYLRYSDDILIILPGDGRAGRGARSFAMNRIRQYGSQLNIKPQKCSNVAFFRDGDHMLSRFVSGGKRTDGLEYLGFRFDGRHIFIRNSTITNINRKLRRAAKAHAYQIVIRYPGKDFEFMFRKFDVNNFMQRFGRVDFDEAQRKTTFWSYARRAAERMGQPGRRIYHQLRGHKRMVEQWARDDLLNIRRKLYAD